MRVSLTFFFLLMFVALGMLRCSNLKRAKEREENHSVKNSQDIPLGTPLPEKAPVQIISVPFQLKWPVDKARLTQRFKITKKRRRRPHQGIDLAARRNAPIYAAHTGTVVYAGRGYRGYGNLVIIEFTDHEALWATFYAHLSKILVKQGDRVTERDKIGLMGRTGRATGVHLHFELRKNTLAIDPIPYLEHESPTNQRI